MKTINFIALGIGFLWVITMSAKPMLSNAENYKVGTAVKVCNDEAGKRYNTPTTDITIKMFICLGV